MVDPHQKSTSESRFPRCFGPYLRYAISTDFTNFSLFDDESLLFFLVEFLEGANPDGFASAMKEARSPVDLGPSDETRYFTMLTTRSAVQVESGIWDKFVSRVELSLPLKPAPGVAFSMRKIQPRWNGSDPTGRLLIGVLDDGCPFAAAHFLKESSSGRAGTRVRAIWDQTWGRNPIDVTDRNGHPCQFGQTLPDMNYGLEFRRTPEKAGATLRRIGLDEWIDLHLTPAGSIDEDSCYQDAAFASLAYQGSHGAHVLDVLAGRIPPSSRIGPAPPADPRDPPSWTPPGTAEDPTGSVNDVVFVQFARDCIRDATGVWLTSYVYDAILYILSHAHPNTEHVVINLSYGPTTGPHNGTAQLEALLTTFVRKYDGVKRKPKLEIVLAAGNSFASEGHLFYRREGGGPNQVEWTWRLPPDNTSSCFAEIWMETGATGGVGVTLTSPSGKIYQPAAPVYPPPKPLPQAGVDLPIPWGGNADTMWRLQVEATVAGSGALVEVAEHGDWTIRVTGIRENAEVHAYAARTDPNMNVRTGAKRSYFVDAKWEHARSAEAACVRIDGEFDRRGSLIRRHGTLNGIATAKDDGVRVAGSYILQNGRRSAYSSAGPARYGQLAHRMGPDYLLLGDEAHALGGVRARGNRSGSVFRLIGTSAAAPQLARWATRPALPPPTHAPHPPGNRDQIEERGAGNLVPP